MLGKSGTLSSAASTSSKTKSKTPVTTGSSSNSTPMTANQEQLLAAEVGLNLLMDDDVDGAQRILQEQKNSPYALAGLGICDFLAAAVGMEDERLNASMEALALAEKAARKHRSSHGREEVGQWWPQAGMEYEVLLADVAAAQALLHMLSESYVEYMRAVWKLNTAFKHFTTIYKAVFPNDITTSSTVSSIINDLNSRHDAAVLTRAVQEATLKEQAQSSSTVKSMFGFRLRGSTAPAKVHSAVDLPAIAARSRLNSLNSASSDTAVSLPGSRGSSIRIPSPQSELETSLNTSGGTAGDESAIITASIAKPLWTENPVNSFIVSGGIFGHAIFELVFALLPPKARKMFSWLGYGAGDRNKALKLLEVAALTGADVHGSFASLALVSYYTSILVSSGWQSDRNHLISACHAVADRAIVKHPQGKLWIVNKAKLLRLEGQVEEAADQLEAALARPSGFRQATSTLQYELCWVQLSLGRFSHASEGFYKMIDLNSWSHTTYYALSAACLHEIESRTQAEEKRMRGMYTKIPAGFNRKRFMGQPPSSELYLEKRIKFYKAKAERWIAASRLNSNAEWFDSVSLSMALELSLFWNQFAHWPKPNLEKLVNRLEGQLVAEPPVLDTPEEERLCHAVLGACYTTLQDFTAARKYLTLAEDQNVIMDEAYTYLSALSRLYAAILECREAESNQQKKGDKVYWKQKLAAAEEKIEAMFTFTAYDMQGRVEGRGQMLRVEINERKANMGIT